MARASEQIWRFILEEKEQVVKLDHPFIGSTCLVFLNGQRIIKHVKCGDGDRNLAFSIGNHRIGIHLRLDPEYLSYDYYLSIDGILLNSDLAIPPFEETPSEGGGRQWRVDFWGESHTLTLEHYASSNFRSIHVNGECVVQSDAWIGENKRQDETFLIEGHECTVHIWQVSEEPLFRYDLSIDGISLLTGEAPPVQVSYPKQVSPMKGRMKSWRVQGVKGSQTVTVRLKWTSFRIEVEGEPIGKKISLPEAGNLYCPFEVDGERFAVLVRGATSDHPFDLINGITSVETGQKVIPFMARMPDGNRIWMFELEDEIRTVELQYNQWTGKGSIFLDGSFYMEKRIKTFFLNRILHTSFVWKGHEFLLEVGWDSSEERDHYHLSVDGRSVVTGMPARPITPYKEWTGWEKWNWWKGPVSYLLISYIALIIFLLLYAIANRWGEEDQPTVFFVILSLPVLFRFLRKVGMRKWFIWLICAALFLLFLIPSFLKAL